MALIITCDNVVQEEKGDPPVTWYTGYFSVHDDSDPTKMLEQTSIAGRNQTEIQDKLTTQFSNWYNNKYLPEQNIKNIGDTVAQNVMDAVLLPQA